MALKGGLLLKFVFKILIDPLGLPIQWYYEYIILAIVENVSYRFAFGKVGELYDCGLIEGSGIGSFLHWTIRIICFVALWAILYGIISAVKWAISNSTIILVVVCTFVTLCAVVFILIKIRHKVRYSRRNKSL